MKTINFQELFRPIVLGAATLIFLLCVPILAIVFANYLVLSILNKKQPFDNN